MIPTALLKRKGKLRVRVELTWFVATLLPAGPTFAIEPLVFGVPFTASASVNDDAGLTGGGTRAPSGVAQGDAVSAERIAPLTFGDEEAAYLSIQGGVGSNSQDIDSNIRITYHTFTSDDFEFNASLGVWSHLQDGDDDELSAAFDIGFRYHFINNTRTREADWLPDRWTMYADTGIGIMLSSGDVPPDGTSYNFTPRAGVGFTTPIGESGARFDFGIRWQHFSNASTAGSDDNPARDDIMVYIGVIFSLD